MQLPQHIMSSQILDGLTGFSVEPEMSMKCQPTFSDALIFYMSQHHKSVNAWSSNTYKGCHFLQISNGDFVVQLLVVTAIFLWHRQLETRDSVLKINSRREHDMTISPRRIGSKVVLQESVWTACFCKLLKTFCDICSVQCHVH